MKLWWKHESGSLNEDFKSFKNDIDACEMSKYIKYNKCDLKLYVKLKVSVENIIFIDRLRDNNNGKGIVVDGGGYLSDGTKHGMSDSSVICIYFNNHEKKVMVEITKDLMLASQLLLMKFIQINHIILMVSHLY